MAGRKSPEMGGGGPVIRAAVAGTGSAELRTDDAAEDAGRRVEELALVALRDLPAPSAVRQLARLVRDHHDIVLRLAPFHDRMNRLLRGDGDAVIKRILGEVRQGRPLGTPYFVLGIVDQVCAAEGCSVYRAAQIVARRHGADFNITAEGIRNMHSTFREEFALFKASKYVPGERLTRDVWRW